MSWIPIEKGFVVSPFQDVFNALLFVGVSIKSLGLPASGD